MRDAGALFLLQSPGAFSLTHGTDGRAFAGCAQAELSRAALVNCFQHPALGELCAPKVDEGDVFLPARASLRALRILLRLRKPGSGLRSSTINRNMCHSCPCRRVLQAVAAGQAGQIWIACAEMCVVKARVPMPAGQMC